MNVRWKTTMGSAFVLAGAASAVAQTSSIGARHRQAQAEHPSEYAPRESVKRLGNPVYERYSWISIAPAPPKSFKVHDLLTVVVRQSLQYEAESDLKTKKEFDLKSQLEAFPKFTNGGLGATTFARGKPNVDYQYDNKLTGKGDASREDKLVTRITAKIIDVKPNGQLVLEARGKITHDEESSEITLTGICRKEDITADNTVLSTQVADLTVVVNNQGALRAASTRGWIPKLIDWVKPF